VGLADSRPNYQTGSEHHRLNSLSAGYRVKWLSRFMARGADPRAAWGTIKKRVRCLTEGSSYQLLAISF
jgi:hypothetical protein